MSISPGKVLRVTLLKLPSLTSSHPWALVLSAGTHDCNWPVELHVHVLDMTLQMEYTPWSVRQWSEFRMSSGPLVLVLVPNPHWCLDGLCRLRTVS
ncbi:hypothetical protein C2E23DRAFT_41718 [Lenzites betulinus]|nr:hypothetical protein C2E23DRAFT_41718 [Lenzites betulinus]